MPKAEQNRGRTSSSFNTTQAELLAGLGHESDGAEMPFVHSKSIVTTYNPHIITVYGMYISVLSITTLAVNVSTLLFGNHKL
jgi:hypothetical protein